jgi:hypothetical protein
LVQSFQCGINLTWNFRILFLGRSYWQFSNFGLRIPVRIRFIFCQTHHYWLYWHTVSRSWNFHLSDELSEDKLASFIQDRHGLNQADIQRPLWIYHQRPIFLTLLEQI